MRNFVLGLLLAGTAFSPALAQRVDGDGPRQRDDRQTERSQSREDRAQARKERAERAESPQQVRVERAERVEQTPNVQHVDGNRDRPVIDRRGGNSANADQAAAQVDARRADVRERLRERSKDSNAAQANVNERGRPIIRQDGDQDSVANFRRERGKQDLAQQPHMEQRQARRVRVPEGARPDRPAPVPQTAQHRDRKGDHHWRTDWRKNHKYDWHNHRRHHRSIFRLGFYFDPFGWNYHRYGIGWRLWPSYYSSNYWLNDPYQYRLPYAPYPYRWIRYYNDALLVDTFTGQVVDVIYDFFW